MRKQHLDKEMRKLRYFPVNNSAVKKKINKNK